MPRVPSVAVRLRCRLTMGTTGVRKPTDEAFVGKRKPLEVPRADRRNLPNLIHSPACEELTLRPRVGVKVPRHHSSNLLRPDAKFLCQFA